MQRSASIKDIIKIIVEIKNNNDANKFLKEMFTDSELETFVKRWQILNMLNLGLTQREIAAKLNVSLCKVTRGAKILKDRNSLIGKYLNKD